MQGFRFFSIFTFLFLSLFIQKTCDLSSILLSDETISTTDKKPVIQIGTVVKLVSKQKTHKSVFLATSSFDLQTLTNVADEKVLFVFSYLPKPSFENPSRAPPVV